MDIGKYSNKALAIRIGLLLLISYSFFSAHILAKEIAIYRWVDKNNVVHFSQNLPATDNYKELSTISSFKALSKEEREAIKLQEETEQSIKAQEKERDEIIAANRETYEKNCKAAKLNIKMLNSFEEVLITEETSDGEVKNRVLNDQEKKDKLALSKKHIDMYCED